ncbi:glycosyltransferase [Anaerosalibacter bizertensis]|uniref:Glycosyltransferase n=1 Tax=Anaerosalibacter bizertensis TaxID=932217 RepID=A0A9Q4FLC2_9FIRM|nr:glycosyltransferase [Anaerosalibacter bizertensis]MBV1819020.1 glycosyltransferase [Bacteroidales bacterium MSK.15.36]MCB5559706.1 glycosyltransferase [Anaerosalibacter bizertensis]MCG4565611.1 glycosyltransferase [Anaerosalibacter bizertensis]MCG4582619.1 glycosyltransferase [Anaerosalibacter bizertensis]MCG4585337.1 glycosyltransferase [Anaerosalibacter bizertensis]
MKIMVFDVPAEKGGALSILNEFYNKYKSDEENEYFFVVSKPKLEDTENIKVLHYPWVKKSWFHRLYFEHFIAPKLIRRYNVDEVLSLQNIIIPNTKTPQTVYIHNALPFSEYHFSILEDKLLWIYQNILGRLIVKSIKKANRVIVQTKWMKKACIEKTGVDSEKIDVVPPSINIDAKKFYEPNINDIITFFYPASAAIFKNHKVVVEACKILKEEKMGNFKVVFTLRGNENKHISKLYKEIKDKDLPIEFIGSISRDEVFDYYTKSVLLFPSYIETFGLPMLEAKMHKRIILASDCLFSHEILEGYDKAYFFNCFDYKNLATLIHNIIIKETQ